MILMNNIKFLLSIVILSVLLSCSTKVASNDRLPSEDEFVPVEKFPQVNINKLQKLAKYPELASRSEIEGRVIVKVLVDKTGKVLIKNIKYSDSPLLEKAALEAIDKYGDFEPAVQLGKTVACWDTVPIAFKLRPARKK